MEINNQQSTIYCPHKNLEAIHSVIAKLHLDNPLLFSCDYKGIGQVAMKCSNQVDVIQLDEHGYHNAFSEAGDELSEITCDALKALGVSVLVYFSNAMGADFDVAEANYIARRYGLKLCEVNLPFKAVHLEAWKDFQWMLFDKRLSRRLSMMGAYNGRYQA